jgi:hypothetical protein
MSVRKVAEHPCFGRIRMKTSDLLQKLNRAVVVYQDFGLAAVASRVRRRLEIAVGREHPAHTEWLRYKASVDAEFDTAYGTQTGGIQKISSFTIVGKNARYGSSHIASDPRYFTEMMADLHVDLNNFTFIDLGSGKGRALMLASAMPFRRLIGIEFCSELHEAAIENFATLAARKSTDSRVELIYGDAAAYAFPVEPLVIYMFNPFGSSVVRQVANNALASWRRVPRPVHVLYMNPVHLTDFINTGWRLSNRIAKDYAHLVP